MWNERIEKLIYYLQIETARLNLNTEKLGKIIMNPSDYDKETFAKAVMDLQEDKGKLLALQMVTQILGF